MNDNKSKTRPRQRFFGASNNEHLRKSPSSSASQDSFQSEARTWPILKQPLKAEELVLDDNILFKLRLKVLQLLEDSTKIRTTPFSIDSNTLKTLKTHETNLKGLKDEVHVFHKVADTSGINHLINRELRWLEVKSNVFSALNSGTVFSKREVLLKHLYEVGPDEATLVLMELRHMLSLNQVDQLITQYNKEIDQLITQYNKKNWDAQFSLLTGKSAADAEQYMRSQNDEETKLLGDWVTAFTSEIGQPFDIPSILLSDTMQRFISFAKEIKQAKINRNQISIAEPAHKSH
ncbi:uncharacterized protein PHALS_04611 [Plasmopara halstedii]|uniref:Uncharacterized protein n=1 Tax=Plasmopara halstedii TaxID=4781 RepID=A0A0N7L3Y4_PLAHL|nr:uncharacterized protein PHALS_04611 [Plasmopara halstedii]CEG37163.1 hypothetical protein PHALS_04611 [Plasmopara halstedii]|eukprot:XP_024573532.1 hypothetical protein PHALS_04611 [Plasmopara halstedii]